MDDKDLIYEGIATLGRTCNQVRISDDKDLIYEGIATHVVPAFWAEHVIRTTKT